MTRDARRTTSLLPRTLLLTRNAPDTQYASAEVMRDILKHMPADRLRWACLRPGREQAGTRGGQAKSFPPRMLHWRLRAGFWQYLYTRAQARRIAGDICDWARDFDPELLWVLCSVEGIAVAGHLERMLGIPVHMTVHDAFELDRVFMPHAYLYGIYRRDLAAMLRRVTTMDAVCMELIEHVKSGFETQLAGTMVFPPSAELPGPDASAVRPPWTDDVRRIGLCGNPRVERRQWEEFVGLLAGLPFVFEIHAFGNTEIMAEMKYPPNVRLVRLGYAPKNDDIVAYLGDKGISVCYLGLYRDAGRAFFGRTSLSSKLTTYVAAGCPVCVDGPADSVAWRLVSQYDAGVLVNAGPGRTGDLVELLSDGEAWKRKGDGARRLCATEMDLAGNTGRLMDLMTLAKRTAGKCRN